MEAAQVMMEATEATAPTPSTAPRMGEAAVGASAMALREAAATTASVSLRNMIVLLNCAFGAG
jgi:hypothetical protein